MTGNSQHSFTNGKSHLTNFIASVKEITEFVGKGRAVDFMNFDISRSFDDVSPSILVSKLGQMVEVSRQPDRLKNMFG